MRIEGDIKLGFKDVLIRPKRSSLRSRSGVDLKRTYTFKHSQKQWTGIPLIASNMDTVGTFSMAEALAAEEMLTAVHKHYSLEEWTKFSRKEQSRTSIKSVMVSAGILDKDYDKLASLLSHHKELEFVCLDVANGYTQAFVDAVKKIRADFTEKTIVAGNVVTPEMTEELIISGADIIKVGIGPGSVCTTRVLTGIGYPQLSAVVECADAAHGLKGHIISDGGCVNPGDVAKAFAAGADFVMLGGMLAGHIESEGKCLEKEGKSFYEFYGMSSKTAMEKHSGGVKDYRASEGKSVLVPAKGRVSHTLKEILGGIRSTCTYVGAQSLKELSKRTTFIRVKEQENQVYSK